MIKAMRNSFWVASVTAVCLMVSGCGDEEASKQLSKDAPLPSVTVSTVSNVTIKPSRRFIGRTEAVEDVQIKARINGYLLSMDFIEGQKVKKGDVLFEIDPKPYEAEVSRLTAEVSRQQASLTNAKRNFRRGNELIEKGFISAMEMDDLISRRDQAKAALQSSEASLETAKLNLSYTTIRAPISGRIGRKSLSIGDLVSPDSGVLVTIVTVDPMYITFDISEKLMANANNRNNASSDSPKALPTPRIELPNGEMYGPKGKFDFVDNRVDPATGTVKVRAVFPNENGQLIPGQYVTAVVSASEPKKAILIPQAAVSEDQQGHFVMLIGDNDTVQVRRVTMGERIDVSWEVEEGLSEGERLIVEGLQKVRTGQQVNPVEQTIKAFDETNSK
ncbi:efflux RND transporter periplasmic adaptor subunit [Alkalimarinus alittae]|uniref:Efflux RND transporter periplasmic adaptor subunit n=1 Tax=Alkalimarinus alittae TaxID=2961619 RepID=A0ABY6MYD6_9ALTE|nr:efflux RND transporter periplasmic adaptor subunit [Alkalimarinus alittae]UZE94856.1 efflux RND transporter periplasmic adaptor subunit [Alkalimarinus alittae]